jgi:tryptophan-rich sensory protein
MKTRSMKMRATEFGSLVSFLALVLGGGLIIGFVTALGAWYSTLSKPPFNPPSWIFARSGRRSTS